MIDCREYLCACLRLRMPLSVFVPFCFLSTGEGQELPAKSFLDVFHGEKVGSEAGVPHHIFVVHPSIVVCFAAGNSNPDRSTFLGPIFDPVLCRVYCYVLPCIESRREYEGSIARKKVVSCRRSRIQIIGSPRKKYSDDVIIFFYKTKRLIWAICRQTTRRLTCWNMDE